MTGNTKGHQIIDGVMPETTSWLDMVDMQVLHRATQLASPSISLQGFQMKVTVSFWIKLQSRLLHFHCVGALPLCFQATLSVEGEGDSQPTEGWNEAVDLGWQFPN
jgi:hypothetical protein